MNKRFFNQPQVPQPPLVRFDQPQQWPNQPPAGEEDDADGLAGDSDLLGGDADLGDEDLDDEELEDEEPISGDPPADPVGEALRAERRRTNQLERELRTVKRQLGQFSKINPEEYERLKEADRQKEQLEHQIAHRERQLQADADRKVRSVAKQRDKALEQINELRKERLLERLFIDAEGRPGGDNRGSFFDIFKQQVGAEFRLEQDANGRDELVPIDSKGNPLLGDDGQLSSRDHVETLRTHPVLGFLFSQRGGLGPTSTMAEFDGNGTLTNLQTMSSSELYLATYAKKPAGARH